MAEESRMAIIPAGSVLTVTTGEYSDYIVRGVFRALMDIDAEALRAEYLEAFPAQAVAFGFEYPTFLGWIARRGALEAIDAYEWHLCDGGAASAMNVYHSSD